MLRKFTPLAVLFLLAAAPLAAQTTITPFGGRLFPMRSLIIDTSF